MVDDIKDEDKDTKENEGADQDIDIESASAEPDFAPTSTAPILDEEDDAVADPHSSFDEHVAVAEDPHQEDIYGDAGAPAGFSGDDEDEEEDEYDGDSDSY